MLGLTSHTIRLLFQQPKRIFLCIEAFGVAAPKAFNGLKLKLKFVFNKFRQLKIYTCFIKCVKVVK